MTATTSLEMAPVSEQEAQVARDSSQAIARFINGDLPLNVSFTRSNGDRLDATIPAFALRVLAQVLSQIAQGKPVTLIPAHAELTTHQAAELLHVSRPFLIKMLDQGLLPHRKVGKHRRIRYDDLQAYLEREAQARRETLNELATYDQEIGLFDPETK